MDEELDQHPMQTSLAPRPNSPVPSVMQTKHVRVEETTTSNEPPSIDFREMREQLDGVVMQQFHAFQEPMQKQMAADRLHDRAAVGGKFQTLDSRLSQLSADAAVLTRGATYALGEMQNDVSNLYNHQQHLSHLVEGRQTNQVHEATRLERSEAQVGPDLAVRNVLDHRFRAPSPI